MSETTAPQADTTNCRNAPVLLDFYSCAGGAGIGNSWPPSKPRRLSHD